MLSGTKSFDIKLRSKMKKLLLLVPLVGVILSGCRMVDETIDALENNREAVDMSTCAIEENIQAIEDANQRIEANRQQLDALNQTLEKIGKSS